MNIGKGYKIFILAAASSLAFGMAAFFIFGGFDYLRIRNVNLQKFYLLEKQDPLIAGFQADPARLERTVRLLSAIEKSSIELTITHYWVSKQGIDLGRFEGDIHFLPMRFLGTLSNVERRYGEFMARPTRYNAVRLLAAQDASARFYRDDASALAKIFEWMINAYGLPLDALYTPLTQTTITTPEMMLKDLGLIAQNGEELLREISFRGKCLFGGVCGVTRAISWNVESETTGVPILPKRVLFPPYDNDILGTAGPYFVPTTCFGFGSDDLPIEQPFYLVDQRWGSLPDFVSDKLAMDVYYTELGPEARENPLLKDYIDAGVTWYAHGEPPYRCNDLSYIFRLTTLDWLVSELKTGGGMLPTQDTVPESATLKEAQRLEQTLIQSTQPHYRDARKLGELYERILGGYPDMPEDVRERLSGAVLTLGRELVDLDRIFMALAIYQVGLDDELRGSVSIDANYLFLSRMYPSVVFLTHSPSVWRLDQRPVLVRRPPPDFVPSPRIKTFTELRNFLSEEALIDQMVRKGNIGSGRMKRAAERFKDDY